jgi:hypothetical protein
MKKPATTSKIKKKPATTSEITTPAVGVASMLDAGTNIDDLTKAVANSVKVNSGACPQKGGAGSETGGARGPTRSDLDLSGHVKEEVPDVKPLPDSGDNDLSATPLYVESSSEEEAVMPLFEPGEGMEEPERPDAAQAARPTAGAEKDAAQEGEGGGEEAEAGGEAKGEGGDPKPRAEAAEAEKQCAQAQAEQTEEQNHAARMRAVDKMIMEAKNA